MTRSSLFRAQRGASALVALVFLVIVAFVVLTAYRLSGQQLMLAGNAQSRAQALAATNFAVERTISTVDFLRTPALVAATPIGVDIDGNGGDDLNVTLGMPVCYRLRVVPRPSSTSDAPATSAASAARVRPARCWSSTAAGPRLARAANRSAPTASGASRRPMPIR